MNFPGSGLPSGGGAGGRPPVDMNDPNIKMMQSLMESCFAKTAMSGVAGFGLGGIFGMFMASMSYDTPFHTPTPTQQQPGATPAAGAAATAGKTAAAAPTGAAAASTPSTIAAAAAKSVPKPGGSIAASTVAGAAATASLNGASVAGASRVAAAAATSAAPTIAPAITMTEVASLPLRQQLAHGFRDMGSRSWSSAKNFGTVGALFSGIECGIEGLRAKNDMTNGVMAGCLSGAILARNAGPQAAAFGCAGFAAFSAAIDAYLRMPPSDDD